MTTALIYLIIASPFALIAGLAWAAHRSGSLRLRLDQFRLAARWPGACSKTTATCRGSRTTSTPSVPGSNTSRSGRPQACSGSVARKFSTACR